MEKLKIDWDDLTHCEDIGGTLVTVYNNILFTGTAIENYEEGKPLSETEIINGKWSGWSREWYSNGQLKIEEHYIHSVLDGMKREWFENGQLKIEKKVIQSIVVESKEWGEEGNLIKSFVMDENASLYESLQISLKNRARWLEIVKEWESKTIYVENGKLVEK
jgi:antitoxin component YwqK of YwqJK toxin-antitoxin module